MSDSLLSHPQATKSNRVDPPHNLMAGASDDQTAWMALAGHDPSTSHDQLDRQTTELLAYVQQQNDEIDARQAELNAKLAQLDNELRAARLRSGMGTGEELIPSQATPVVTTSSIARDDLPPPTSNEPPNNPSIPKEAPKSPPQPAENSTNPEFEEVDKIVAQLTTPTADSIHETSAAVEKQVAPSSATDSDQLSSQVHVEIPQHRVDAAHTRKAIHDQAIDLPSETLQSATNDEKPVASEAVASEPVASEPTTTKPREDQPSTAPPSSITDMFQPTRLGRVDSGIDIHTMASSLDASELESERRLLAERKNELDRRQTIVQRMQDEAQTIHREALEMRLVTEQLWSEISDKVPPEHVAELLQTLQTQLDEAYRSREKGVEDRRQELQQLKDEIQRKQEDVRDQSRRLQEWLESRHDEIKSYAAEVDAREALLDRREHRMSEEFSKWEATRSAYQSQLQSLLGKLNITGIGE